MKNYRKYSVNRVMDFILLIWGVFALTSWIGCSYAKAKGDGIASIRNQPEYVRKIASFTDSAIEKPKFDAYFVKIPAGTFQMGSPSAVEGLQDNEVGHSVTLTKDFEIQQTEVTQFQWVLVMGYNTSYFRGYQVSNCPNDYMIIFGVGLCPNHPVDSVTWNETQYFIGKLNAINDGYIYRLPTEAEWEYAARGGTQTDYSFGNNYAEYLRDYGWFNDNSNGQSHPVGSKKPNQYDLYDMHGNVSEWTQSWFAKYPSQSQRDPLGPTKGEYRVHRGGSWSSNPYNLRSADRGRDLASTGYYSLGFRLVRTAK